MAKDTVISYAVDEYLRHGLALVPLKPADKMPCAGTGWNQRQNMVTNATQAKAWFNNGNNVGVHLKENGLASLDPDVLPICERLFKAKGLDLQKLLNQGHRLTGAPGRGRSIFRVPDGVSLSHRSYTIPGKLARDLGVTGAKDDGTVNVFELRAGSPNLQDVLPPSVHPQGRHRYTWHPEGRGPLKGAKDAPLLPPELVDMFLNWDAYKRDFDRELGLTPPAPVDEGRVSAGFDLSILADSAPRAPMPKAPLSKDQLEFREVVEAFGELHGHDFGELLERHGYTRHEISDSKTKWLHPNSTSKDPGLEIMRDGKHISSHNAGDPLTGGARDYFQVWAILEHGGNLGAAIRGAKKLLDWKDDSVEDDFGSFDDSPSATAPTAPGQAAAKPAKRKLRAYTPKELKALPPRKWLIEDFIPEGGEACIYGPPGGGKSFASLDLALCVARGLPWHGKKVQQGSVIYVAAEGGSGQSLRLEAYEKQHGIKLDDVPFYLVNESINLVEADDVQAVIDLAQSIVPVLVIVDTLARSMGGAEENSATDMTVVMNGVKRIIEASGACVLLIHHTGKAPGKGARGSNALLGAVDTMLAISRDGLSAQRTITLEKSRDSEDGVKVAFSLMPVVVGVNEDGKEISVPVVVPAAVPQGKLPDAGARAPQSKPGGVWQQRVMRVMDRQDGEAITLDELVQQVKEKEMPPGEGRSRARGNVKTAVAALHGRGVIQGTEDRLTLLDPLLA